MPDLFTDAGARRPPLTRTQTDKDADMADTDTTAVADDTSTDTAEGEGTTEVAAFETGGYLPDAAEVAAESDDFDYPVSIEDAGPATKKVTVQIPGGRIAARLKEQFGEVRSAAQVPGFRVGRVPLALVEKKFGGEIRGQVAQDLVRESYQQAIEKQKLQVLGEPEFDRESKLEIPDGGADLSYTFKVEVQPEIDLPDPTTMTVRKPVIKVNDDHVAQAMQNLRDQQGTLVPVEGRGAEEGDYLTADVTVTAGDQELAKQSDAQLVARPGRIAGIEVQDFAAQVAGLKLGESKTLAATVPDTHPNEAARGRQAEMKIELKDLKKLEPAVIDDVFLESLGFENEDELKQALREQMEERVTGDVQQNMRQQVMAFLLNNVQMELPAKMSAQQADRVVQRRAISLLQRGMPEEQIRANVERLRSGAGEEAGRELKLFFVLQKVALDENVDVGEAEINGRVAMLALQNEQRPEKLKADMSKDGRLQNLYLQMREQKAVDALLARATIEEIEMDAQKLEAENKAADEASGEAAPADPSSEGAGEATAESGAEHDAT